MQEEDLQVLPFARALSLLPAVPMAGRFFNWTFGNVWNHSGKESPPACAEVAFRLVLAETGTWFSGLQLNVTPSLIIDDCSAVFFE